MLDAQGVLRVSSGPLAAPNVNFADREYFKKLSERDIGTYIGQRVHSRITDGDRINMARRRTTVDGKFDGILIVNVRPDTAFLDVWAHEPRGTVTSLVREDSSFLARYPKP